jgi:hypothetical protein
MDEEKKVDEPVVLTQNMMLQLIEQLNAVTTYFDLLNVKLNKMNERIKKLEDKK